MDSFTVSNEPVWMWKDTGVALCTALAWGAEENRNIISTVGRCSIGRDSNLGPRLLDLTFHLENGKQ